MTGDASVRWVHAAAPIVDETFRAANEAWTESGTTWPDVAAAVASMHRCLRLLEEAREHFDALGEAPPLVRHAAGLLSQGIDLFTEGARVRLAGLQAGDAAAMFRADAIYRQGGTVWTQVTAELLRIQAGG